MRCRFSRGPREREVVEALGLDWAEGNYYMLWTLCCAVGDGFALSWGGGCVKRFKIKGGGGGVFDADCVRAAANRSIIG